MDGRAGIPFEHTYLVTATADELVRAAVPAVHRSFAAGDGVHVNLAPARQAVVRAALGDDADRVSWSDATAWAPHAARRLREIQGIVDEQLSSGLPRVWFLGECAWDGEAPELMAEWERFDAVLNATFVGRPVTVACIYDAGDLPAEVVERAGCSHPLYGLASPAPCPDYIEPASLLAAARPDRLPVPASALRLVGPLQPARARAQLASLFDGGAAAASAAGAPLPAWMSSAVGDGHWTARDDRPAPEDPVGILLVAATELVTNSWQAGAGNVEVACWRDGPWILVQVDDDGPGLTDPLAGYHRPALDAPTGRGLWIVRQLMDGVDIAAGKWGTSVRLRVRSAAVRFGERLAAR